MTKRHPSTPQIVCFSCIFELWWCWICLLTARHLKFKCWKLYWLERYILLSDLDDHSDCEKIVAFGFWQQTHCWHGSTNLDTKSLSILRACFVSMSDQWNGDALCKSLCLLWTENANSLNEAIKRNTSWDGLLRFRAISQDQRVAKTNSFNKKWCCLLSKFGNWLNKFVDLF